MKHKVVGDIGVMNCSAHSACPNCNSDVGYYAELLNGFTCDVCGAEFTIEIEPEYWYCCVKEGENHE
jgi:transcription initiation factor IIE alpha subunit